MVHPHVAGLVFSISAHVGVKNEPSAAFARHDPVVGVGSDSGIFFIFEPRFVETSFGQKARQADHRGGVAGLKGHRATDRRRGPGGFNSAL